MNIRLIIKLIFLPLIIIFGILVSNVSAEYIDGSASTDSECTAHVWTLYYTSEPTIADIAECRTDVARQVNESRGLINQIFFAQPSFLDPTNFSLVSWVTFAVNLGIFGLFIYWIFLIIKSGFIIISSAGNPDKLQEGVKQIRAVLTSLAALFVFIIILIIAGNFFGIGSIWDWPNSFRQCSNFDNKFYFTVNLEMQGTPFDCN